MRIKKLYIAFFILVAATMVACEEYKDTVEPSPTVSTDNPGVRFYSENPAEFVLEPDGMSFSLTLVRDKGTGAIEVPLAVVADTAGIFDVPSSVSFAADVDTVIFTVTADENAPKDLSYGLEIEIDDEQYTNPYKAEYPFFKTAVFLKPPCAFNEVTLNLVFDGYASETTWELMDVSDEVIASGGPWADGEVSASATFCLEDGTYTFTIYDAYGDGLSYPANGSATMVLNGEELFSIVGNFGKSKSETFTLGAN